MPIRTLPGHVEPVSAGQLGFDIDSALTTAQAQIFVNAGYSFCIRYIPRVPALLPGNLSNAEAGAILNAGLALMAVQHVSPAGWIPNTNLGTLYGQFAANYANQVVGLPEGLTLWCDLEGVAGGSLPQGVIGYCQAWYYAVHAAGYVPGMYVGYDAILTPEQLYNDISFQNYWQAFNGPNVVTRGFQMIQGTKKTLNDLNFDPDSAQIDVMGDSALWLSL